MRKLVRSTFFCSSFLPYHIFSFFHVLHCLRIHSFFEYNRSLCENVGSARSVDHNSKIIIIIILFILLGCFPQTYGLLTGAPRKVKHERTNGR